MTQTMIPPHLPDSPAPSFSTFYLRIAVVVLLLIVAAMANYQNELKTALFRERTLHPPTPPLNLHSQPTAGSTYDFGFEPLRFEVTGLHPAPDPVVFFPEERQDE